MKVLQSKWNKKDIYDYTLLILGAFIVAFSIKNLYAPINLVTGGFSGLAIIANDIFGIPLWFTNTVLNIPIFILAVPKLGWKFLRRTLVGTLAVSVGLYIIPEIDLVSKDMLLSSLFGGILTGVGMGFVFIMHATTGGTDALAALIHSKFKRFSIIEIMQVIDALVVLIGISTFGITQALYALIAIYACTKVSDDMVEGLKFSKQAFIISDYSDVIADAIMYQMQRGVTSISAKGMYSNTQKQMLFCVVAKKEIVALKELVKEIDKDAFITLSDAREVFGEGFIE